MKKVVVKKQIEEERFVCDTCGFEFGFEPDVRRHEKRHALEELVKTRHMGLGIYLCETPAILAQVASELTWNSYSDAYFDKYQFPDLFHVEVFRDEDFAEDAVRVCYARERVIDLEAEAERLRSDAEVIQRMIDERRRM